MNILRNLIATSLITFGYAAAIPTLFADEVTVKTTTTKHHYVYYGDHEIYFAPESKVYYWRENGTWRSGAELPVASRAYVRTGGVEFDLESDHPYERHDWVKAHIKEFKHHVDRD